MIETIWLAEHSLRNRKSEKNSSRYDQSLIKNFKENIEQELKASVIERAKVKRNGKWFDVRSIIYGWKYKDDDCENED